MGVTKDELLGRLKDLKIDYVRYDHPVVLTVEAQAKYLGETKGSLTKNLFLKDKKCRYYIISALSSTKVDMKILSQRLGLGKGGIRMAPEEALHDILQVPLGCVTPFAVVNESARNVSLILDKGIKCQKCCIFHPLSNDTSISVSSDGLDMFLKQMGRTPSYVDLEDNPPVGKDQPPDLASLVPLVSTSLPESEEQPVSNISDQLRQLSVKKSSDSKGNAAIKSSTSPNVSNQTSGVDSVKLVEQFLEKISSLQFNDVTTKSLEHNDGQLGCAVADSIRKHLGSDLNSLVMMFKNSAYTSGFQAGIQSQRR